MIYSLLGFYLNWRAYNDFAEGHPRRWEVTLSLNIVVGLIRPKVSISKGSGHFQQLHDNLSLHFTLTDSSDLISFPGTSRPRAL